MNLSKLPPLILRLKTHAMDILIDTYLGDRVVQRPKLENNVVLEITYLKFDSDVSGV